MLELTPFRQSLRAHPLADPAGVLLARLQATLPPPSGSVAIAVGSRGIANLPALVAAAVEAVRSRGGQPFLVPAMGSHGAATAAGQVAVLARLGVTAASAGAPVRSTLETTRLGLVNGVPVEIDRFAAAADSILLLNRIKPHTSFTGRFESGLLKQLAVGLGNQAGAAAVHRPGIGRLGETIEAVGRYALARLPLLAGIALVEDGLEQTAIVEPLTPAGLLEREPVLLAQAKDWLPRLPFDDLDVLVVERIGKDVSGTGMDPNVIGRRAIRGVPDLPTPRIRWIVALALTEATGGNGLGIGFADLTCASLVRDLDPAAMMANALTTGLTERVRIPLTCATEAEAIETALALVRDKPRDEIRLARIRDTQDLEIIWLSPALHNEARQRGLMKL